MEGSGDCLTFDRYQMPAPGEVIRPPVEILVPREIGQVVEVKPVHAGDIGHTVIRGLQAEDCSGV